MVELNSCVFLVLMREPVLQDKRQEHLKFCKYAMSLIERVLGKQQTNNMDVSLERLRKVSDVMEVTDSTHFIIAALVIRCINDFAVSGRYCRANQDCVSRERTAAFNPRAPAFKR